MQDIANIRKDYKLQTLLETDISSSPFTQFNTWWQHAIDSHIEEVNAMTLATINSGGMPDARIVLLKGFSENGFVFFTNYASQKGQQLAAKPQAALVFFWKELERQIRVQGHVTKISEAESDAYFASRPVKSQIGAVASAQSEVIANRETLEKKMEALEKQYTSLKVPRPQNWGGYLLIPSAFEFWQGRRSRLHDRIKYKQENENWLIERLSP